MSAANDSLTASLRAYLDRDWGLFERLRDRELVSQRRHGTLPATLARTAGFPRAAKPRASRIRRR